MPYFTNRGIIPLSVGGGGFTPADLTNLLLWCKADAGVYEDAGTDAAENGDGVVQWNDQSGNGYHMKQAGAAQNKLIYTTGALNSLPALVQNPTADAADIYTDGTVPLGGSTISAFGVFFIDADAAANERIISVNDAADDTNNAGFAFARQDSTHIYVYMNGGGTNFAATITPAVWNCFGIVFNGSTCTIYVNGVSGGSASATPAFGATVSIGVMGQAQSTADTLKGSCAEFVVTTDALTTEIADLQTYFEDKYGSLG